ncbi:hypothetical protein BGZ94_006487, partial [Podila epigama]
MVGKEKCCRIFEHTINQWSTNHPKWIFALAGYCEINGKPTWCGTDDIRDPPEELLPEDGPQWDVPEPSTLDRPTHATMAPKRLVINSIHVWPRYSHHEIFFDAIGQRLRYLELTSSIFPAVFDLTLALEHLPCLEHVRLGYRTSFSDSFHSPMFVLLNAKEQRVWYNSGIRGVNRFNDAAAAAASKKALLPKPTPFLRLQKLDLISTEMPHT